MTATADLIAGAKFRADLTGSDRVSDAEWVALANQAIYRVWSLAASARLDFQVASQDVSVASGVTASYPAPASMFGLIDVVANPDTTNEYSLGPFNWQNRKSPGAWGPPTTIFQSAGAQRARLMGSTIYLEPASSAGATYRTWFCPRPTLNKFIVDYVATSEITAGNSVYNSLGGVGDTLTSTSPGTALSVDLASPAVGSRVLIVTGLPSARTGLYAVTRVAAPAVAWVLTRATDYDQAGDALSGDRFYAVSGAALAGSSWTLTTADPVVIGSTGLVFASSSSAIDAVLEPFAELIQLEMAISAVERDESPSSDWKQERSDLRTNLSRYFALTRANAGAAKIIDTDARGPSNWRGGW